jgi:hypothetical protein
MIFSNFCNSSRVALRQLRSVLGLGAGLLAAVTPMVSSAGVVEPQWSWINVNFDTQSRPGLIGPAGGTNMTWNESIGTAGLTKFGLLNSNGVATPVGFTCSANCMYDWGNPPLPLLTAAAFSWVNNSPSDLVISGLTPGKKYVLYVASHHPNELGGRSVFSTANVTTTSGPQLVDNGGPNGKTYRWLRGVNYARFDKIEPDATNSIRLTMVSGSDLQRSYINGFQLIEDPSTNTCSFSTWLTGFNFSGISNPDLTLEGDPDRDSYTNMEEYESGLQPTTPDRRGGVFMTDFWNGISGFSVDELLASSKFFNEPDSMMFRPLSGLKFNAPYSGSRSRGYITPTVTGDYTFWLSARTSANLLFSTDLSRGKYAKRRIAAIGADLGHGTGNGWG